jgi:hypothetical protein
VAFITGVVPESLVREITASPAEFERDLRKAWAAGVEQVTPGHLRLHDGGTRLDIHVEVRGVRRLGLFELPVLSARYHFSGGGEPDRRRLLATLDRAMQRGGG